MIETFDLIRRTTRYILSELHQAPLPAAPLVYVSRCQNGRATGGGIALAVYSDYSINQGAKNGMSKNQ